MRQLKKRKQKHVHVKGASSVAREKTRVKNKLQVQVRALMKNLLWTHVELDCSVHVRAQDV